MGIQLDNNESGGIPFCMNCVGWHPDQLPDIHAAMKKMQNGNKDALAQHMAFDKKRLTVYKNKSCALCGRSYKADGNLDESWEITAKRVKEELDHAGVFGVADNKVKLVVAKCRKAVEVLFANRPALLANAHKTGDWMPMQKLTFSGQLAFIITVAQEERRKKLGTSIKGTFDARN